MNIERIKMPVKVALAVTLSLLVAMWLGLEKPYWAAATAGVLAATETSGHSLRKGRHRVVGTVLGIVCAFILLGMFAQQPGWFLLYFTVFTAYCVYRQTELKNGYMWSMISMACMLVFVMGQFSGELTFKFAMIRLQETLLGVVCFTLVFSFLWPVSSRRILCATLVNMFADQQQKLQQSASFFSGKSEYRTGLGYGDGLRFVTRVEDLIAAASMDSYAIARKEKEWQRFMTYLQQWVLVCGHFSEACELYDPSWLADDAHKITEVLLRIEARFKEAQHRLTTGKKKNLATCTEAGEKLRLCFESGDVRCHGTLSLLEKVLNQMDVLSAKMLHSLSGALDLGDKGTEKPILRKSGVRPSIFSWCSLEPERVIPAIKVTVVLWICIWLWLYVAIPGGPVVVMLGVVIGSVIFTMPVINIKSLFVQVSVWSGYALFLFITVLPHMTEAWQLAAFYFINIVILWYVFSLPQQVLTRLVGTQLLLVLTMDAAQQTPVFNNIEMALLLLTLTAIAMAVVFFVNHTIFSSQSERVLLRQMSWIRHLFIWKLRYLGSLCSGNNKRQSIIGRMVWAQATLPPVVLAEQAMARIRWHRYPQVDKARLAELISHIYSANLRLLSLKDSYEQYLSVSSGSSVKCQNQNLDRWVANVLRYVAQLLAKSSGLYSPLPAEKQLKQIEYHLVQYQNGVSENALLSFAISKEKAAVLYQLVASLILLFDELETINQCARAVGFEQLRLQYFEL
ncbi:FUSC family protein [Vibrio sp. CAU 1672]|uniref:FUSC family protein n=1 Tax=Vibrio sp. CAU 1672 TaxID=3032594 RepID=UPI0023DB3CC5|nr:FUSC family protein [Vibrio sp. CAU 1672]MDF2154555.1 FUSC family protein [Vibrio sp. CAU 1672]